MSVQWTTLAASAGVAALVTMLIDLTAKPWLEARKDRTIRRHRDRDEVAAGLLQLCIRLSILRIWAKASIKTDEELLAELRAIEGQVGELYARAVHIPLSLPVTGIFVVALASCQVHLGGLQEDYRELTKRQRKRRGSQESFSKMVYADILDCELFFTIPSLYLDTKPWNLRRRRWLNSQSIHMLEHVDDRTQALLDFGAMHAAPSVRRELDPSVPRIKLAQVRRR